MQIILIQIIICYTKQLVTDITDDTSSVLQIIIIHIVLEKLLCVLEIMLWVLILLLEINATVATIHFYSQLQWSWFWCKWISLDLSTCCSAATAIYHVTWLKFQPGNKGLFFFLPKLKVLSHFEIKLFVRFPNSLFSLEVGWGTKMMILISEGSPWKFKLNLVESLTRDLAELIFCGKLAFH